MENESLSLYEDRTQSKEINILKTVLPYLNSTSQKHISMLISYMQMQRTMEYFENPENTMQLCAMEKQDHTADILHAVKKHCTPKEQQQIDQALNALQMISTYDILFSGGSELL
jgi:DNA replication protein DnaD